MGLTQRKLENGAFEVIDITHTRMYITIEQGASKRWFLTDENGKELSPPLKSSHMGMAYADRLWDKHARNRIKEIVREVLNEG